MNIAYPESGCILMQTQTFDFQIQNFLNLFNCVRNFSPQYSMIWKCIYVRGVGIRLHGGSTKNGQKYTINKVNNADFRNDLHFFVTSSRPIKAEPKGLKSATFGLQNLPERREIEFNVIKYGSPFFTTKKFLLITFNSNCLPSDHTKGFKNWNFYAAKSTRRKRVRVEWY